MVSLRWIETVNRESHEKEFFLRRQVSCWFLRVRFRDDRGDCCRLLLRGCGTQQAHVTHAQAVSAGAADRRQNDAGRKDQRIARRARRDAVPDGAGRAAAWHSRFLDDQRPGGRGTRRSEPAAAGDRDARADCAGRHVGSGAGSRLRQAGSRGDAFAGQPTLRVARHQHCARASGRARV